MKALITQGKDPATQKLEARNDLSVNELCDLYFAQPIIITKRGTPKKASSLTTDKSNIDRHIRPLLGTRRIGSLTRVDIEKLQIDIASGKTATDQKTKKQGRAIVRGGKGTAARSVAVFVAILEYGVSIHALSENPGRGGGRIAAKLLPGAESENRLMRVPVMLPVALVSKAIKIADDRGQTLDAFIVEAVAGGFRVAHVRIRRRGRTIATTMPVAPRRTLELSSW